MAEEKYCLDTNEHPRDSETGICKPGGEACGRRIVEPGGKVEAEV